MVVQQRFAHDLVCTAQRYLFDFALKEVRGMHPCRRLKSSTSTDRLHGLVSLAEVVGIYKADVGVKRTWENAAVLVNAR